MPSQYPYFQEPTHQKGNAITLTAANASRDTAVSGPNGEQRLIIDAVDKIFLLEPEDLLGSPTVTSGK